MKALVKKAKGKGQIELLDYPVPQVKEGYVLLRIEAAGICGSDLKIYNDDHPYFPPVILGHEFSGEIVEVGPGVQGWKKGDRVVSEVHGSGLRPLSFLPLRGEACLSFKEGVGMGNRWRICRICECPFLAPSPDTRGGLL